MGRPISSDILSIIKFDKGMENNRGTRSIPPGKEQKLKRNRMEHEKKIDTANHYDCLETDVREDARKNFKRQPYKSVDVAKYIAKKFGIGGDADGQKDS